ncbi:MAG TPA: hypothetical protein VIX90_16030 [Edaphobacter sp.]
MADEDGFDRGFAVAAVSDDTEDGVSVGGLALDGVAGGGVLVDGDEGMATLLWAGPGFHVGSQCVLFVAQLHDGW